MKNVKFIKDHFSGIAKGTEKNLQNVHAARLEKEGYVEITGDGEPDKNEKDEFLKYKLNAKDIKFGYVGAIKLGKEAKMGDEIEVPNPNFSQK